jgi:hypothetical protein
MLRVGNFIARLLSPGPDYESGFPPALCCHEVARLDLKPPAPLRLEARTKRLEVKPFSPKPTVTF